MYLFLGLNCMLNHTRHSVKNQHAASVLSLMAVTVVLYGLVSFYRVQLFITIAIVIIALENMK